MILALLPRWALLALALGACDDPAPAEHTCVSATDCPGPTACAVWRCTATSPPDGGTVPGVCKAVPIDCPAPDEGSP